MPRRLPILNFVVALIVLGLLGGVIWQVARAPAGRSQAGATVASSQQDGVAPAADAAAPPDAPAPLAADNPMPAPVANMPDVSNNAPQDGTIVIKKAVYGVLPDGPNADVTANIADKVQLGITTINAENSDMGGDPASNVVKQLRIDYTIGGREYSKTVNEHDMIKIDTNN